MGQWADSSSNFALRNRSNFAEIAEGDGDGTARAARVLGRANQRVHPGANVHTVAQECCSNTELR